jgi:transcriptional regulator with XRE-family HTH domain
MAPIPYQAVFANNLSRFREQRGLTQEELARLAAMTGLPWLPVTVHAIERGRRKLSLGEAILLQHLLGVPLSDLAATTEGSIDVEGVVIDDDVWRALAPPEPAKGVRRLLDSGAMTLKIGIDARDRAAEKEAQDEAERKAAKRLGIRGVDLVEMAHGLWGHGLTAERDRRLSSAGGEVRARRGHVTRELLDEMRQAFAWQDEQRRRGGRELNELMERLGGPDSVVIEEEDTPS